MATPKITAGDRLSLALFLAAVVHGLVILGVGFTLAPEPPRARPPMIEVTIARAPSAEAPEEYDYLAQADQDGGGEAEEAQRPREATPAMLPDHPQQPAPASSAPRPSAEREGAERQMVTSTESPEQTPREDLESQARKPDAIELIDASRQLAADTLMQQDPESISARYPSKRRIDARTRQHDAAAYMHAWVEKVERVGNMNYPEAARSRKLSGRLILEVTLAPDGSVRNVRVLQPSRHRVLDEAAKRIVNLAGPFAPVPEAVLAGNDLLVIT